LTALKIWPFDAAFAVAAAVTAAPRGPVMLNDEAPALSPSRMLNDALPLASVVALAGVTTAFAGPDCALHGRRPFGGDDLSDHRRRRALGSHQGWRRRTTVRRCNPGRDRLRDQSQWHRQL
jgi:hypothetical protein